MLVLEVLSFFVEFDGPILDGGFIESTERVNWLVFPHVAPSPHELKRALLFVSTRQRLLLLAALLLIRGVVNNVDIELDASKGIL